MATELSMPFSVNAQYTMNFTIDFSELNLEKEKIFYAFKISLIPYVVDYFYKVE